MFFCDVGATVQATLTPTPLQLTSLQDVQIVCVRSTSSFMPRNQRWHVRTPISPWPNLIIAPLQGCAPDVSGLYDITSKWQLRTRVSNACTHMLTQILTRRHRHAQIIFSSQLWILSIMLLISISPNSCRGGACADTQISTLAYLSQII